MDTVEAERRARNPGWIPQLYILPSTTPPSSDGQFISCTIGAAVGGVKVSDGARLGRPEVRRPILVTKACRS